MNWNDKLIDYIENQLSSEQLQEVESALAESEDLRSQLAELKTIIHGLDEAPLFQPSDRLKNNFELHLASFPESGEKNSSEGKEVFPCGLSIKLSFS